MVPEACGLASTIVTSSRRARCKGGRRRVGLRSRAGNLSPHGEGAAVSLDGGGGPEGRNAARPAPFHVLLSGAPEPLLPPRASTGPGEEVHEALGKKGEGELPFSLSHSSLPSRSC
ncbi:Hypothetical predicted protein [Podarcis lilfordi]|uniref:Uncharacterized protein n=1 Tax=Podarcis lilfordi TaxID=74358 RepID=A0AA35KIA5_9SAUR|nr:Hypothetical predicted protein [Podarcis lilfordi]